MVLHCIFLDRQQDIDWVNSQQGAAQLFPAQWQALMPCLSAEEQKTPLLAFLAALQCEGSQQQVTIVSALYEWQNAIGRIEPQEKPDTFNQAQRIAHFKIQLHYAINHCFIADKPLLCSIEKLSAIPTWIIQGQYDLICPTQQTWALHQALPQSQLLMIHLAGHTAAEEKVIDALVSTTDKITTQ